MSVAPTTALPSRPSPGAAGAHLGRLYADHSRMVYGVCRMLLRDPNEAEDATQQVFLSAYRGLLTGTEVRDPAAWLGTIARNACRRRAVARLREPLAVDDDDLTLVSPGVEETAIGREEAAALYAEVGQLPGNQREAVVLRDLYGLRYDEVAKALGTSRPAVEALLFRGRRRLQRRLSPGFAAGVLVVPLAVQESIAYAVPGFASAAAPAGALATAAGVPLLAKLAAGGVAISLAGSAGVVAERGLHDPPVRTAGAPVAARAQPIERAVAAVLPVATPAAGPQVVSVPSAGDELDRPETGGGDDDDGRGDRGEHRTSGWGDDEEDAAPVAGGVTDDDGEHRDNSGTGGGAAADHEADESDREEREPAETRERADSSGRGSSNDEHDEHDERDERDEPDQPDEPDEPDVHVESDESDDHAG